MWRAAPAISPSAIWIVPDKTGRAVVCDLTPAMLDVGRDRAIDRGIVAGIDWLAGDAQALPLHDRSADAYTIAFGLRNVTDIDRALAEAHRVLKPGGRFICLEFSQVVLPLLKQLYDLYSFRVLPWMGRLVAGDKDFICLSGGEHPPLSSAGGPD